MSEGVDRTLDAILDLMEDINKFKSAASRGPLSYYIEKLRAYKEGCLNAASFKVGDMVKLKELSEPLGVGWEPWRKELSSKPIGEVVEVDYYTDTGYQYDVAFQFKEDEDRHIFCIKQDRAKLKKVK